MPARAAAGAALPRRRRRVPGRPRHPHTHGRLGPAEPVRRLPPAAVSPRARRLRRLAGDRLPVVLGALAASRRVRALGTRRQARAGHAGDGRAGRPDLPGRARSGRDGRVRPGAAPAPPRERRALAAGRSEGRARVGRGPPAARPPPARTGRGAREPRRHARRGERRARPLERARPLGSGLPRRRRPGRSPTSSWCACGRPCSRRKRSSRRWFSWRPQPDAALIERLVGEGRLVRPAAGWVAAP